MEQKSSNAALIVIALAVIIVVAMVCGLVMWVLQRQMALSERLLDVRLAEAEARRSVPATPPVPQPTPAPESKPAQTPEPKATPASEAKPEPKPAPKAAPTPAPKSEQKPAPKPEQKPTPAKRKAPQERADVQVGPDGQPLNRIILPVGNDDLDWQF